jgi:general secretion pathway protein A
MYEQHWGLTTKPFRNTPDPRFLYASPRHEEAMMKLAYAVTEGMGAAMLTGVFGCGKTLISRALVKQLGGRYEVAILSTPVLSGIELLRSIVRNLKSVDLPEKKSDIMADALLEQLNEVLVNNIRNGKETVIIVDEAHAIDNDGVFDELRMLLNFQEDDRFLVTLLLFGQPELADKVSNLKQLEQRVAIKCHLDRLNQRETSDYIDHRMKVAGAETSPFDEDALKTVFDCSGGIPRKINHICDLSLLTGFGRKAKKVDVPIIEAAMEDFGLK